MGFQSNSHLPGSGNGDPIGRGNLGRDGNFDGSIARGAISDNDTSGTRGFPRPGFASSISREGSNSKGDTALRGELDRGASIVRER